MSRASAPAVLPIAMPAMAPLDKLLDDPLGTALTDRVGVRSAAVAFCVK